MADNKQNPTASDMASRYADKIEGKTLLVTGVSPKSLAETFLLNIVPFNPSELIISGRNEVKMQQVADKLRSTNPRVKIRLLVFDISSLAAVRTAAEEVNGWPDVPYIDILVNSAGILAKPWATSADGFEMQWATNYLGHFLFTNLLMNKILAAPAPRIITLTSEGHRLSPVRFGDLNFREGESYHPWSAYGQSKTATSLMAISLAEKLGSKTNLLVFALNPGTSPSSCLYDGLDWQADYAIMQELDRVLGNSEGWISGHNLLTVDECAAAYVHLAFDPELAKHNGMYIDRFDVGDPFVHVLKPWATSHTEAERLWKLSEQLVRQTFDY
ncbi:retinol dehydrogenase 13 [Hypoxylon cercidicola]|nr:retinol dehydrogenase 13 [Hypoxylon cercidicola]